MNNEKFVFESNCNLAVSHNQAFQCDQTNIFIKLFVLRV